MKILRKIVILVLIVSFLGIIAVQTVRHSKAQLDEVGYPFEVVTEDQLSSVGDTIWTIKILMSKKNYSQEGIERLFRYYSMKYPNKNETLSFFVYTDPLNIKRENEVAGLEGSGYVAPSTNQSSLSKETTRPVYFDAVFQRTDDGGLSGGDNEWYIYSPDPDNPNERVRIILRGLDPFSKPRKP